MLTVGRIEGAPRTDDADTDHMTPVLAQDYLDAEALVARYDGLTGDSTATAKKRQTVRRRFVIVVGVALRLRQQVLYPAAEAAGVPRGLLMDARRFAADGLELLEGDLDPSTVVIDPDVDPVSNLWKWFTGLFHYEAAYFLPACRTAELHRTNLDRQLAIRKRELSEEAVLEARA